MNLISKIYYLNNTYAPINIIYNLAIGKFNKKSINQNYSSKQKDFREIMSSLDLSGDWFTNNIPYWLWVFNKYKLKNDKVNVLEIGSWEGLSSYFILNELPNARLTCVDTWEGADEHKSGDATTQGVLSNIESSFDSNMAIFKDRVTKYKGTSYSFFNDYLEENTFDLIYIDGSHYCDDVIIDTIKSFKMLKSGGGYDF